MGIAFKKGSTDCYGTTIADMTIEEEVVEGANRNQGSMPRVGIPKKTAHANYRYQVGEAWRIRFKK